MRPQAFATEPGCLAERIGGSVIPNPGYLNLAPFFGDLSVGANLVRSLETAFLILAFVLASYQAWRMLHQLRLAREELRLEQCRAALAAPHAMQPRKANHADFRIR